MAARRRRRDHEDEHVNHERWLLTYADMITLLMTLFMVLFAISSLNTTKLELLSKSLSEAISGKVAPGGPSIQETGAQDANKQPTPEPPIPAIQPVVKVSSSTGASHRDRGIRCWSTARRPARSPAATSRRCSSRSLSPSRRPALKAV